MPAWPTFKMFPVDFVSYSLNHLASEGGFNVAYSARWLSCLLAWRIGCVYLDRCGSLYLVNLHLAVVFADPQGMRYPYILIRLMKQTGLSVVLKYLFVLVFCFVFRYCAKCPFACM